MQEDIILSIKKVMAARKVTQAKVAEKSGMSRIAVNRFLNGRTSLRLDHFLNLCNYLGIKIVVPEVELPQDERTRLSKGNS